VRVTYPGCTAWSAPVIVTNNESLVSQITPGGAVIFCRGKNVILYGNTCTGYLYQWKRDGEDIEGATLSEYAAAEPGTYQLKIIHGSSMAWSALVTVTVNNCANADSLGHGPYATTASDQQMKESFLLNVFPNPSSGMFSIDLTMSDPGAGIVSIAILNAFGDFVYSQEREVTSARTIQQIELSGSLPGGVYFLRVRIGKQIETTRILLNR
jgi:hypothetical protein